MKKITLGKEFLKKVKIMAECQNEILEVVSRPSCVGDDQAASVRYWEICEIISTYNQKVEDFVI